MEMYTKTSYFVSLAYAVISHATNVAHMTVSSQEIRNTHLFTFFLKFQTTLAGTEPNGSQKKLTGKGCRWGFEEEGEDIDRQDVEMRKRK